MYNFDDDEAIRKAVTDQLKEEKIKEESIKFDIELIETWRVIEERILVEKTKLLKKLQDEFRHELKLRYLELDKKYGGFDIKNKYRRK